MAWDLDQRFAPFGWAIACEPGTGPASETSTLGSWVEHTWQSTFCGQRGYVVDVHRNGSDADAVRLTVRRGDFRADVAIEGASIEDPRLRMFGSASSSLVSRAMSAASTLGIRSRRVGAVTGITAFLTVCWLVVGESEPVYPLSGLLMVVMLLFSLVAGGGIGGWIGDKIASRRVHDAERRADDDAELQHDLERWKALARVYAHQRDVIGGRRRRQPFRVSA